MSTATAQSVVSKLKMDISEYENAMVKVIKWQGDAARGATSMSSAGTTAFKKTTTEVAKYKQGIDDLVGSMLGVGKRAGELSKPGKHAIESYNSISKLKTRIDELNQKLESVEIGSKRFKVLQKEVDTLSQKMNSATQSAANMGNMAGALGGGLAFGVMANGAKKLADAAQQAESQTKGLAAVVTNKLGQGAVQPAVMMVENLSKSLGLSKGEMIDATKNLISMNFTLEQTQQMLKGATDIAVDNKQSHYNLSESIKTWTDGLKNNNSTLSDSIGVSENISAQYKRLGIDGDLLTKKNEGIAGRQKLVNDFMAQFGVFAGRGADNMKGYAGALSVLDSSTKDLYVSLGKIVKDAMTPFMMILAEGSQTVSNWAKNLGPTGKNILLFAGAFVLVGSAVLAATSAVDALMPYMAALKKAMATSFGPVGIAIMVVVGLVVLLIANWDKFSTKLKPVLDNFVKLKDEVMQLVQPVIDFVMSLGSAGAMAGDLGLEIDLISTAFAMVGATVSYMLQPFIASLRVGIGFIQLMIGYFSGMYKIVKGIFTFDWELIKSGAIQTFTAVKDFVVKTITSIKDMFVNMWDTLKKMSSGDLVVKQKIEGEKGAEDSTDPTKPKGTGKAGTAGTVKVDIDLKRLVNEFGKTNKLSVTELFDYQNLKFDDLKSSLKKAISETGANLKTSDVWKKINESVNNALSPEAALKDLQKRLSGIRPNQLVNKADKIKTDDLVDLQKTGSLAQLQDRIKSEIAKIKDNPKLKAELETKLKSLDPENLRKIAKDAAGFARVDVNAFLNFEPKSIDQVNQYINDLDTRIAELSKRKIEIANDPSKEKELLETSVTLELLQKRKEALAKDRRISIMVEIQTNIDKATAEVDALQSTLSKVTPNNKILSQTLEIVKGYEVAKSMVDQYKTKVREAASAEEKFNKLKKEGKEDTVEGKKAAADYADALSGKAKAGAMAFASGLQFVSNTVEQLGSAFVGMLQATAQLEQVKFNNLKQNLSFMGSAFKAFTDQRYAGIIGSLDQELKGIEAEKKQLADAEKAFQEQQKAEKETHDKEMQDLERQNQDDLKALREEYKAEAQAENDAEYQAAVDKLAAERDEKIIQMELETTDEQQRVINRQFIDSDYENSKLLLKEEFTQKLEEQNQADEAKLAQKEAAKQTVKDTKEAEFLALQEAKQAAQDAKKLKREQQLDAQKEDLEKRKADAEKRRDDEKRNADKAMKLYEWASGRGAFEASKKAQLAQAQISMATGVMNAIVAGAVIAATMGPIGWVLGPMIAIALTGMVLSAGMTSMSAISSTQYPPPPIFAKGGFIDGNNHSNGGTMINAEGGEYIINRQSTAKFLPEIQAINAGNSPQSGNNSFSMGGVSIIVNNPRNTEEFVNEVDAKLSDKMRTKLGRTY